MSVKVDINPRNGLLTLVPSKKEINPVKRQSLMEIGLLVRSTAVRGIQRGPRTGKFQKLRTGNRASKRRTRVRQRSAPGEYPKSDTGRLAKSIVSILTGPNTVAVGTTFVKYGRYLEEGTRHMAPRPFLQPSVDKNANRIQLIVKRNIDNMF